MISFFALSALAQASAAPPPQGGSMSFFVPLLLMMVIFYFLLIRPERKRRKALDAMMANLKPGDRVLTTGGLYGTVVAVGGDRVQLRIADQVKVDMAKSAVAGLDASEG